MQDSVKTITLNNVLLQENGILRDENGRLLARLVDSVKFDDIENSLKRKVMNTKLKKETSKEYSCPSILTWMSRKQQKN